MTLLHLDRQRGRLAMDATGVLPSFRWQRNPRRLGRLPPVRPGPARVVQRPVCGIGGYAEPASRRRIVRGVAGHRVGSDPDTFCIITGPTGRPAAGRVVGSVPWKSQVVRCELSRVPSARGQRGCKSGRCAGPHRISGMTTRHSPCLHPFGRCSLLWFARHGGGVTAASSPGAQHRGRDRHPPVTPERPARSPQENPCPRAAPTVGSSPVPWPPPR